jgi:hypothetical protein
LSAAAADEPRIVPNLRQYTATPRQLPADLGALLGRQRELERLSQLASLPGSDRTGPIVVITGMAGVGKTMLALRWAHQAADRFPDGQLYLDMRAFQASNLSSSYEALGELLHGLGVAEDEMAVGHAHWEACYRTVLADKRMLIVLDHVANAEQIRPLLPATSGSVTLITSRNRLSSLVAREGAHRLTLNPLTPEASRQVLVSMIGPGRAYKRENELDELAWMCGHLPLALRIAAVNLADNPHREVAEYVYELRRGDRLAGLAINADGGDGVEAAFDLSYQALNPQEQRVFRDLALLGGSRFDLNSFAAWQDPASVYKSVQRLVAEHLVVQVGVRMFAIPELLRAYARRLPAPVYAGLASGSGSPVGSC